MVHKFKNKVENFLFSEMPVDSMDYERLDVLRFLWHIPKGLSVQSNWVFARLKQQRIFC